MDNNINAGLWIDDVSVKAQDSVVELLQSPDFETDHAFGVMQFVDPADEEDDPAVVTTLSSKTVKAILRVAAADDASPITLVLAVYKNGTLADLTCVQKTSTGPETLTVTIADITDGMDDLGSAAYKVTAFCWTDFQTLIPYLPAVSIDNFSN